MKHFPLKLKIQQQDPSWSAQQAFFFKADHLCSLKRSLMKKRPHRTAHFSISTRGRKCHAWQIQHGNHFNGATKLKFICTFCYSWPVHDWILSLNLSSKTASKLDTNLYSLASMSQLLNLLLRMTKDKKMCELLHRHASLKMLHKKCTRALDK